MNDKKSMYYTQVILKSLIESSDMVTTEQLAEEVGLSEKTIRTKIESINNILMENNLGIICKKRRIGIWLDATDEQKLQIQQLLINQNSFEHLHSDQSRMFTALKYILSFSKNNRLTTNKLSEEMFLSIPTTLKIINDCKDWLNLFDIQLKIIRNKGFELKCNESQYRIALKHFLLKLISDESIDERLKYFMHGLDLEKVKKCILVTEKEWGIEFAEESFNEIYAFLCMSITRPNVNEKFHVEIPINELRMLQAYNEYSFAEAILKKAEIEFNSKINAYEIGFLSIPILCSKMIDPGYNVAAEDIIRRYDETLQDFVRKIIKVVSEVLNRDLTHDDVLFHGLLMHIKPAIFRLRYERSQTNTLKGYIKNEFKHAFRVSWLISVLFEEHFDLRVTEDELSYITLYIQSALERNEKPVEIVLVTRTSMGVNQMLCDKIKRAFVQIANIKVVSVHDFKIENYRNTDLIITTQLILNKDNRVVEIDELLSDNSIKKIKYAIDNLKRDQNLIVGKFDLICHSLFDPELIYTHLDINDKSKLLKFLCDNLVKKGFVTKKYYQTVMDREYATPTSIGNMVAIPHGDQNEINEAKIVIVTLKEPIMWDTEQVDVIFLLVVKMTNEYEIKRTQLFYKQYINLVNTDKEVNVLRSFDSPVEFYKFLVK